MTPFASLAGANLQGLPFLFPDATVLDPDYYAVKALNQIQPAFWDGTRMSKVPTFQWGKPASSQRRRRRSASPAGSTSTRRHDFAISLTKIKGRHTIKTGFYTTHSYKAEQVGNQRVRHDQLPAGRGRHQPVRHVVRLRQRRDRHASARSSRRSDTSRPPRSIATWISMSRTTGR